VAPRSKLIRLAVFGRPVTHSLSPAIHQQFARQSGLRIDYRAIEAGPDEFGFKLRQLVLAGGRGCNITVPLKHLAWQMSQRSSPSAEQAQAANTLVFEGPDDFYADNTDGRGLLEDLARCWSRELKNRRVLILGAGGAAAGILGELLQHRPAVLVIGNRTPGRARTLARRFSSLGSVESCALGDIGAQGGSFDLVINATSLGHSGASPVLPETLLTAGGLCYDLNYGPAAEPLRIHCENRGIRYQDGLGMLVEQAAISFELWTGKRPDSTAVLQQLRRDS